jgi:hypothetical protein
MTNAPVRASVAARFGAPLMRMEAGLPPRPSIQNIVISGGRASGPQHLLVRHMADRRGTGVGHPKEEFRLHAMNHAYLEDLVREGTYGGDAPLYRGRYQDGLNEGRTAKRNINDFGGPMSAQD